MNTPNVSCATVSVEVTCHTCFCSFGAIIFGDCNTTNTGFVKVENYIFRKVEPESEVTKIIKKSGDIFLIHGSDTRNAGVL